MTDMLETTDEEQSFSITDDKAADWAIKKIKEDEAERDRLVQLCKDQIDELKEKIEGFERACENSTKYLKFLLSDYFAKVPHKETKTQESYKLVSGSLVYKKPKQELVKDDDSLLEWLENSNLNEFVETSKRAKWAEVKKRIQITDGVAIFGETGEILDCVTVQEKAGEFEVK